MILSIYLSKKPNSIEISIRQVFPLIHKVQQLSNLCRSSLNLQNTSALLDRNFFKQKIKKKKKPLLKVYIRSFQCLKI